MYFKVMEYLGYLSKDSPSTSSSILLKLWKLISIEESISQKILLHALAKIQGLDLYPHK